MRKLNRSVSILKCVRRFTMLIIPILPMYSLALLVLYAHTKDNPHLRDSGLEPGKIDVRDSHQPMIEQIVHSWLSRLGRLKLLMPVKYSLEDFEAQMIWFY
ncbi:unnamed protein product [Plutella xylostella]|uniref:(diamondback moth) hypothetical protein n=1 Tax=Plutella xylostella TaxID=51655 RepID=A0A8S4GF18_PLUXY|nr:unnamed protein product [Plutella xylostella]